MTRHVRRTIAITCAFVASTACAGSQGTTSDTAAGGTVATPGAAPGAEPGAVPGVSAGGTGDTAVTTPAAPTKAPRPAGSGGQAPGTPATPVTTPAGADTIRGIAAEVGSIPVTSIVVRPAGGRSVTILGDLAREIGRAAGADVWVRGRRTPQGLVAEQYAVRTVDGQPAVDGVVAAEGDGLALITPGGARRIARPPQALRGMIGARVWLVGDLDGSITSYGVLRGAQEE